MTDQRYFSGIDQFNLKSFFEAHETLEGLWHEYRETDRTFLQALIQISAGFYHLDQENLRGARSQLTKGAQKLGAYSPSHAGVDVAKLISDVRCCLDSLTDIEAGNRPVDRSLFPSLHFSQSSNKSTGLLDASEPSLNSPL